MMSEIERWDAEAKEELSKPMLTVEEIENLSQDERLKVIQEQEAIEKKYRYRLERLQALTNIVEEDKNYE